MAHGFIIKCEKCGSEDCRIGASANSEYIEIEITCEECGQVE